MMIQIKKGVTGFEYAGNFCPIAINGREYPRIVSMVFRLLVQIIPHCVDSHSPDALGQIAACPHRGSQTKLDAGFSR
jgi:hypothetical protein